MPATPCQARSAATAQEPPTFPRALTVSGLVLRLAAAAHTPRPVEDTSANTRARLLAALVLLPVTVLARRRMGLASIAATSDAGQLSLHTAFTTLPGPGDGPLC